MGGFTEKFCSYIGWTWLYFLIFLFSHRKHLFDKTIAVSREYSVWTILQKKKIPSGFKKKDSKYQRISIDILKPEILLFCYKKDSHFEILCLTQNKTFKNKI